MMEWRCLLCWHLPAKKGLFIGNRYLVKNIEWYKVRVQFEFYYIQFYMTDKKFIQDLTHVIIEMLGFSMPTIILRKPNMFQAIHYNLGFIIGK